MPEDEDTVNAIADEIAHYLARHPLAADTAIGVQRYWLTQARGAVPLARVEDALARLERKGIVARRVVFGGSVMFSARAH